MINLGNKNIDTHMGYRDGISDHPLNATDAIQYTFNKNRAEHISDIVGFPPEHNTITGLSNQEKSTNVALDLIEDITKTAPTPPFASIEARKLQAIRDLEYIFKQTTTPH